MNTSDAAFKAPTRILPAAWPLPQAHADHRPRHRRHQRRRLYAEIGDPARDSALRRLCSYAGLVARLKQTGGPDKEAHIQGRSRRACVPLKRRIMDIALKIGQYGQDEIKADYQRRVNERQDVA